MDKLNVLMRDIVEKEVKHYQSDIEIDFKIIEHDNKDYKNKPISYIWFTRESGTVMMREDFITVKNSADNIFFNYWVDSAANAYRIKLDKICPKNMYGTIEKINLKKYYKEVKEKEKEKEKILCKIELQDGKIIEKEYDFEDGYFNKILFSEKLDVSMVKSFKILDYI